MCGAPPGYKPTSTPILEKNVGKRSKSPKGFETCEHSIGTNHRTLPSASLPAKTSPSPWIDFDR